jgi:hypothetical protein
MVASSKSAEDLFNETLAWLESHYWDHPFFLERDLVWTVQRDLTLRINQAGAAFRVHNDYPMIAGPRRSLSADIALLDLNGVVELAVEFKYEPSHKRLELLQSKFPVVFWGADGVGKDVARVQQYVQLQKAKVAIAVFIDEDGYFTNRTPHPGSEWRKWDCGVSVLYSRAP